MMLDNLLLGATDSELVQPIIVAILGLLLMWLLSSGWSLSSQQQMESLSTVTPLKYGAKNRLLNSKSGLEEVRQKLEVSILSAIY